MKQTPANDSGFVRSLKFIFPSTNLAFLLFPLPLPSAENGNERPPKIYPILGFPALLNVGTKLFGSQCDAKEAHVISAALITFLQPFENHANSPSLPPLRPRKCKLHRACNLQHPPSFLSRWKWPRYCTCKWLTRKQLFVSKGWNCENQVFFLRFNPLPSPLPPRLGILPLTATWYIN